MKKQFLAWVGTSATTGQPHQKTGRLNRYGSLYFFDSEKERNEFCSKWHSCYSSYPVKTNKKEAKSKYFAGMTQYQFDEYVKLVIQPFYDMS